MGDGELKQKKELIAKRNMFLKSIFIFSMLYRPY